MPGGKPTGKSTGRTARHPLFSEALQHSRPMTTTEGQQPTVLPHTMAKPEQETTMEHILQKITAIGQGIEGMDSAISLLTAKTPSMPLDIVNFQSRVTELEQRGTIMEDHLNTGQDRDQELLYLRSKLVDLEARSRRNNVHFLGFPEQLEGTDIQDFLRKVLPTLTNKTFDSPLELQRAY
ncbi:hypothetical protein NDU88_003000 [Pleurodeles waltl]|uniref:Uncharacterized protein n=1 Tax=Pleurodeles waltl TaxID=8319 RepID=A0AAV7W417_PLEWA|nr:hypothetical protein NDU88_003000 [Pleurodeles waltl]